MMAQQFIMFCSNKPTLDALIKKYFQFHPTASQLEFFSLYAQYFLHPEDAIYQPPQIVLATGAAGTGKTVVVDAVIDTAIFLGFDTIQTACNHINAADIHGHTTASLVNLQSTALHSSDSELDNFTQITKILNLSCKFY